MRSTYIANMLLVVLCTIAGALSWQKCFLIVLMLSACVGMLMTWATLMPHDSVKKTPDE